MQPGPGNLTSGVLDATKGPLSALAISAISVIGFSRVKSDQNADWLLRAAASVIWEGRVFGFSLVSAI